MALYTYHTLQDAAEAIGDGTAIDLTDVSLGAATDIAVQVTGTFVGTLYLQGTVDGTNYTYYALTDRENAVEAENTTSPMIFTGSVRGLSGFRVRVNAYTSGAITVVARVLWEK